MSAGQLTWCGVAPEGDQRIVALTAKVIHAQEPLFDIVQRFTMHCICWPLPLQFEH